MTGTNKNEKRNRIPVTTDVNPVRPPDAMPAAVSAVATGGLDPNIPDKEYRYPGCLKRLL